MRLSTWRNSFPAKPGKQNLTTSLPWKIMEDCFRIKPRDGIFNMITALLRFRSRDNISHSPEKNAVNCANMAE